MNTQVLDQLMRFTAGGAKMLASSTTGWSSGPFAGTRYTATFDFAGIDNIDRGEAFLELFQTQMPRDEAAWFGERIVEASVKWTNRQISPNQRLTLQIELLTLQGEKAAA